MKQLKYVIAASGLAGIVAIFLPYISVEGMSMSLWDAHKMPGGNSGLLNGPNQVWLALACFAVPMLLGGLAIATKQLARWQAATAAVFSLLAFAPELVRKGLFGADGMSTAIGGKLVFLAALVGLASAVAGAAKPDKA